MTSHEGGPHGARQDGSGGDPGRGWDAPPAPPPPPAFGASPGMERPFTVRAGIGAFMANLILGLIGALVAFASLDALVAGMLAAEGFGETVDEELLRTAVIAGYGLALVFVVLQALFIWFAWEGRNWARIALWVVGGLSVLSGLASLGTASTPSTGFLTSLSWFGFALALAGIVLLAQPTANEWYRHRGSPRPDGRGR